MLAILRQLEQQFECRGLERELEQQPDEFEQQRGLPCGLQLHLKLRHGDSGATGICCPALGEIYLKLSFW